MSSQTSDTATPANPASPRPTTRRAWLLAIVLIGHLYALYKPGGPEPGFLDLLFPAGTDKVVHVALFAVPAFLLRRFWARWWPILLLALHAPVSELIQWRFVPYRSGDPLDLLADVIGIAAGVATAAWATRRGRVS